MRQVLFAIVGAALAAPARLTIDARHLNPVETVGCRSVWRCGPYGCGWRRVCFAPRPYYSPSPYYRPYGYGHRPYYGYRPYYSRPYYRPYYRPAFRPYDGHRPYYAPRPYYGGRVIFGPYGWGVYDPRNVW
jgi:hypothetical protein